jgi:hypothetical protein
MKTEVGKAHACAGPWTAVIGNVQVVAEEAIIRDSRFDAVDFLAQVATLKRTCSWRHLQLG